MWCANEMTGFYIKCNAELKLVNSKYLRDEIVNLTLFFRMFPSDPPGNIRKPKVFLYFQGDQKGTLRRKRLIQLIVVSFLHREILSH